MGSVRRTKNRFAKGYSFQIALLLEEERFLGEILFKKRGQPCTVDADALALMDPLLFPPFIQDQSPFPFRTTLDLKKGIGRTGQPLSIHKGIGPAHIKRLVPNLDRFAYLFREAHQDMVITQPVYDHSACSIKLCIFGARGGTGEDEKLF